MGLGPRVEALTCLQPLPQELFSEYVEVGMSNFWTCQEILSKAWCVGIYKFGFYDLRVLGQGFGPGFFGGGPLCDLLVCRL